MSSSFVGRTFGRFHIVEQLGAGGMGEVYLAHDTHLKRDVAIKLLPGDTPDGARRQMRREAHALSTLNHPSIATIHDLIEEDGVTFVVMEYIAGTSLATRLESGPLPPEQVRELAKQIASALEEAHRHGIIHRDLKPGNIMLTAAGQVKLVDFGIASRVPSADAATQTVSNVGRTAGTLPYMAPEQVIGDTASVRSDIWAFGVVLFEMVTGQRPFPDLNALRLAQSILNSAPARPSTLLPAMSPALESVILRALQKAPEDRFQTVAEMAAALESKVAVANLPATEVVTPLQSRVPAERVPKASSGKRVLAAAAAAALLLAAYAAWRLVPKPAPASHSLSVLVADTVNRTGDAAFDDTVTELLTTSLNQSRFLAVYPRTRAAYVMRLMQRDPASPIDDAVGLEICQREGLGALVSASLSKLGAAHVLLVSITDPAGQVLATARESFDNPSETPARIDAAVLKLRAEVGESSASIRASSVPLAEVSSPSLEAVKFYTLGQQRARAGETAQAMVLYQKALEVDPGFAMAQDALGLAFTNIQDLARAEEHLAKAVALADKVGEAERHKILADYNMLRRDYEVACSHLQVLTELRPLDPVSFMALGICKAFQLDFAGAIIETERGLRMQAYPLARANLARWQLGNGEAEAAWATAETLRREQPTVLQANFVAARAELALGRLEEARRTYETMVAGGGPMGAEGRLGLADLALGTGRYTQARVELDAACEAAERGGVTLAAGRAAAARAELALAEGRPDDFDRAMARLQAIGHPVVIYLRGRSYARAGRAAEAGAVLTALAAATGDSAPDEAMRALLRAELALARGDAAAAADEADAAWGFEPSVLARETQARAYAAAGRPTEAIRLYSDALARHTQRLDSYDAPGFHRVMDAKYRLGALLDEAGEHERARPYLEAFVKAWAGADPGLQPLADAQRRLAKGP